MHDFWEQNGARAFFLLLLFLCVCAPGIQSIKELFTMRASTSPRSPVEHFPTGQHHINVDSKPQSAGKVNCDRIVYENSFLLLLLWRKAVWNSPMTPSVKCRAECYQETKLNPGAGKLLTSSSSIIWPENEGRLDSLVQSRSAVAAANLSCRGFSLL